MPINAEKLIDFTQLCKDGSMPYTFLSFPRSIVDENGLPTDKETQEYIAAVQELGVPVGIWVDSFKECTSYAAVRPEDIESLTEAIKLLEYTNRFSKDFTDELHKRLFGQ